MSSVGRLTDRSASQTIWEPPVLLMARGEIALSLREGERRLPGAQGGRPGECSPPPRAQPRKVPLCNSGAGPGEVE